MTRAEKTEPSAHPGPGGLADQLLHFLDSLGQPSEAELYLRVYRGLPRGRFAVLVPSKGVLVEHAFSLAEQLGFIRQLGLSPSLLIGAVSPVSKEDVDDLLGALQECGFVPRLKRVDSKLPVELRADNSAPSTIDVIWPCEPSDEVIRHVVEVINPRKLVFLRRDGGLGPHGGQPVVLADGHILPTGVSGIAVVNLRRDADDLMPLLSTYDQSWLQRCRNMFADRPAWNSRATISIASPLSLLRELFTERGEGTLVKPGARIERHLRYDQTDAKRLRQLLEQAFGRGVKDSFFLRQPESIYVEKDFRGVALLERGVGAAFLSKLAVLPVARGEGLGQDLWWEMSKQHPAIYLRARPQNPIAVWYAAVCDGMQRTGEWNVYWKGVPPDVLPGLIQDAVEREEDFSTSSAP